MTEPSDRDPVGRDRDPINGDRDPDSVDRDRGASGRGRMGPARARREWVELRELLFGPERGRLDALTRRLDDPISRASEISDVLPDAILLSHSRGERIATAIEPVLDKAIARSVRRNPQPIADAISPSLGPALRRAITTLFLRMVQSLDTLLDRSFSLEGIRWRVEALRTRRPFAEVVLRHTLVYRVEQILLIHGPSGLLLAQAQLPEAQLRDPDLVAGMLRAIQDFVQDSFHKPEVEALDTLRMGGQHSIWIETGEQASLAILIRGVPPVKLRDSFREQLDRIHVRFSEQWDAFAGDVSTFSLLQPELDEALTTEFVPQRTRRSPLFWPFLLGLAGIGIAALGLRVHDAMRFAELRSRLDAEPGVTLLMSDSNVSDRELVGLRDPLSREPDEILRELGFAPGELRQRWTPIYSLADEFVERRARHLLEPPESVSLAAHGGTLHLSGQAPHRWIRRALPRAESIPGVEAVEHDQLSDPEWSEVMSRKAKLQALRILFAVESARILPDQERVVAESLDHIAKLRELCRRHGCELSIVLIGRADPTGTLELNRELSLERAVSVHRRLVERGVGGHFLSILGDPVLGDPKLGDRDRSSRDSEPASELSELRSVGFDVSIRELLEAR